MVGQALAMAEALRFSAAPVGDRRRVPDRWHLAEVLHTRRESIAHAQQGLERPSDSRPGGRSGPGKGGCAGIGIVPGKSGYPRGRTGATRRTALTCQPSRSGV